MSDKTFTNAFVHPLTGFIETAVARRRAELAAQAPVVRQCGTCKHWTGGKAVGTLGLCGAPAPWCFIQDANEDTRLTEALDGAECTTWEANA